MGGLDSGIQLTTRLLGSVTGEFCVLFCVIQVVELIAAVKSEEKVELECVMEQLMTRSVCYVASVSMCAAAQTSGVNTKFWTLLEQRAFDVLEKVFCFLLAHLTVLIFLVPAVLYSIRKLTLCAVLTYTVHRMSYSY